jgi:hypothetical protein
MWIYMTYGPCSMPRLTYKEPVATIHSNFIFEVLIGTNKLEVMPKPWNSMTEMGSILAGVTSLIGL